MAELKIKADSGGGTVSWKGPATTTGNAAFQLTLPVNDGDADQYLKTDGSGALSWATVADTDTKGLIKTVHNYKTDTFSSTTADAWTDITGVTLTNTPAATGNKHMGVFYVNWGRGTSAHHFICGFRVTRSIGGATATVVANSVHGSATGGAADYQSQMHGMRAMYDVNGTTTTAISLYDAPSTTSACVYQVQFYSDQEGTFYLNRSHGDGVVSGRGTYQGILQEVSV